MQRDFSATVYLLASRRNGTVYTGVTSQIMTRIHQHRQGVIAGFARKHGIKLLVWFEQHATMDSAIFRSSVIRNLPPPSPLPWPTSESPNSWPWHKERFPTGPTAFEHSCRPAPSIHIKASLPVWISQRTLRGAPSLRRPPMADTRNRHGRQADSTAVMG